MNLAEFIIRIEAFNANVNIPLIRKAYEFSDKSHKGQKRLSGEPFVEHPLQVALILSKLQMDSSSLAAALLHDVSEDTDISIEQIRKKFLEFF